MLTTPSQPAPVPPGAAANPQRGRIARSASTVALATGVSRILGFVRDIAIATLFGTTMEAQAFVVAFRVPNLLRDLVAEGAVTSAFVPVLSWYRAKGQTEEFWRLSQALFTRLLVFLTIVGIVGFFAAPYIVHVVAPGFAKDREQFELTVRLTRILFPFITLVGLWAYFMGLLNSLNHFAMPALGPAILNVGMIVACVWWVPHVRPGVVALAFGVMVGGIVQLAVQIPPAMRRGFTWRLRWHHEGSREVLRLLGPRLLGSAVYQASVMVDTALASLGGIVGVGAVAALYFANRLVQLPLALFGTATAQASLPTLAEQAAHNDLAGFRSTLLKVIRMVSFVILPASIGLAVLAFPIVKGLFERGAFDRHSTVMTTQALSCYALGLLAFSLSKVLTGAFYALRDTRTPVRLAIEAVLINIVLSVAMMWPLKVAGLALAAAISNTMNAVRLLRRLEQRLGAPLVEPVSAPLLRMTAASLIMGAGCWVMWHFFISDISPRIGLLLVIGAGGIMYLGLCRFLRVQELSTVLQWLQTVRPARSSPSA